MREQTVVAARSPMGGMAPRPAKEAGDDHDEREAEGRPEGLAVRAAGRTQVPDADEAHARDAEARASQQEEKGNLSEADKAKVDRKADKVLGR